MVGAETELLGGAQHAVRLDAADLLALELQPSRQHRAHRGVGVALAGLHVRRTAYDLHGWASASRIHEAKRQAIGVGVLLHLQDASDQDVAQALMQRDDRVDRGGVEGQAIRDVAWVERLVEQGLEPAARDDHRAPPANWVRNRMSLANSSRESGIPWPACPNPSVPRPPAHPVYPGPSPPPRS